MIKKLKPLLSAYRWVFLFFIIIGLIFFLDDTRKINPIEIRKINQTFGCGFDVVWNDWGRSELNLLKQIRVLISEKEEALKKQEEAIERRMVEHWYDPPPNARLDGFTRIEGEGWWAKRGESFFAERRAIDSCLQFMSQKKVSKFAVDKALKQTTYKLFNEAMTSGGIILVTQIVKECYKDLIYRNFPACIMLDNYASQVDISFRKGMGVKEDNQFFSRLNFITRIRNNFPKEVNYNEYDFLINYYDQKTHEIYDDYHSKESRFFDNEDSN